MPDDTTFIQKAKAVGAGKVTTRTAVAGGTSLSVGAVIWIYATFATKADLERHRQSQTTQWQRITQLQSEVNELKTRNHAYEKLLEFVTTGVIRATFLPNASTNGR